MAEAKDMYEAALQAAADANGGYINGKTKQIVIAALNAQACGSIPPLVREFLGKVQGVCMGVAMSGTTIRTQTALLWTCSTKRSRSSSRNLPKPPNHPTPAHRRLTWHS